MDTHEAVTDQPTPSTRRSRRSAVAGAFVAAIAAAAVAIPALAAGNDTATTPQTAGPAATAGGVAPATAKVVMFDEAGKRVSNEVDAHVVIGCAVAGSSAASEGQPVEAPAAGPAIPSFVTDVASATDPAAIQGQPVEAPTADPAIPSWVTDLDVESLLDC